MSVLQHNPNGTHFCHDCDSIVILFDDDIHECTKNGERAKRGDLELRQAWQLIDHANSGRIETIVGDYETAFTVFADRCEQLWPTEEDDDE